VTLRAAPDSESNTYEIKNGDADGRFSPRTSMTDVGAPDIPPPERVATSRTVTTYTSRFIVVTNSKVNDVQQVVTKVPKPTKKKKYLA
jgi:hypothetical protein